MKGSGKRVMTQECPDYVRRDRFWHSRVAEVIGSDAASILARITATEAPSIGLIPFGAKPLSGGHLAAALLLHRVCCSDVVSRPPLRIAVVPDNPATRSAFLSVKLSTAELEDLVQKWRLRAYCAGNSAGDWLPAEEGLVKRRRKGLKDGVDEEHENLHLFFPAYRPNRSGI